MGWNGFAAQELRPDCDCELLQMAASQFSENVNSIFLPSHDCCCRALCVLLKKRANSCNAPQMPYLTLP